MTVQARMKYARMSPKKVVHITRQIQGMIAVEALEYLRFIPRKSARLAAQVLKSAIANAENNHNMNADSLFISRAFSETGPRLKRFNAGPRGQAMPVQKHMCHIFIELEAF
jgi:large subunit ribosomal protein L22